MLSYQSVYIKKNQEHGMENLNVLIVEKVLLLGQMQLKMEKQNLVVVYILNKRK